MPGRRSGCTDGAGSTRNAPPPSTGAFLQIAARDRRLAGRPEAFIDERGVAASAYEHARLYGIQRPLQLHLARTGCPVRVLIAYGNHRFEWYMRRLAERPATCFRAEEHRAAAALPHPLRLHYDVDRSSR
jgi:hypothetical protein